MVDKNKIFQLFLDFASFEEESTTLSIILVFKFVSKVIRSRVIFCSLRGKRSFLQSTGNFYVGKEKKRKRSSEENKNPILKKTIYNII